MLIDERCCTKCKEIKETSKFYYSKTICKICANKEMAEFRKVQVEKKHALQTEKRKAEWKEIRDTLKHSLLHKSWSTKQLDIA